jgi:hypothetical protein
MDSSSPLSDASNVPAGTTITVPPGTTVSRPSNQPEWVIVIFITGAVVLGLAGLMWPGADVSTRHDCYNLALVLASTAGGSYVSGKRPQPPTP